MKILMVSMPSLHFFRWTEQLQDAGHDIYWFNVTDSGKYTKRMGWINQCYGWRLKWDFPGRIRLKSLFPKLSKFIEKFNTNATEEAFENYLNQVKPDVVHSFALHISCTPILPVMLKYKNIKWIYSSWGSDLYARKKEFNTSHLTPVLERVDYLFTDCYRDFKIAEEYGFKGKHLGVYPGGGGFHKVKIDINNKENIVLVKGYENKHGRSILILEELIKDSHLSKYQVIVFGANQNVIDFIDIKKDIFPNIKVYKTIPYEELQKLFRKSKYYIGYSLSDGTPNTMLEALIAGCIVIQSNPGGASEEWIQDEVNGYLLNENENLGEKLKHAISNGLPESTLHKNIRLFGKRLNRSNIAKEVKQKYDNILS